VPFTVTSVTPQLPFRHLVQGAAAVAGLALLAASCAPSPAPSSTGTSGGAIQGGTVIYGATSEAANLDPLLATDGSSMSVSELIFESLLVPDPKTGAPSPSLADSWDQSSDGLTYTFHLHPGVKWSDGQPFTADDVVFTFDAVLDAKTKTPYRSRLANVRSYSATGPQTFTVTLKQVDCTFLSQAALIPIVPKHVLATSKDINTDEFGLSRPIGTGPFMFKEWTKDDHLTLVADPTYWRGRPKLGQWVRKIVKDQNVSVAQLKTGEIDYGQVNPEAIDALKTESGLSVQLVDGGTQVQIAYNLARPLFEDKRVRQALTYAIDRDALMRAVLFGYGKVIDSPILRTSWAFDPKTPKAPYDVNAAKKLLADAGWSPNAQGILAKDGQPLRFTIITRTGAKAIESIPTIAQDMWKKIGVDAQVQLLQVNAFNDRVQRQHDFDAAVYSTVAGTDPDPSATWSSKEYPNGQNYVRYANPTVDRILEQARSVPGCDQRVRARLYAQFQQAIADDAPWTFLYANQVPVVVNRRVQNVSASVWRGSIPYIGWSAWQWAVTR
jgi:peptide/nickel transport system substrate-binding protein